MCQPTNLGAEAGIYESFSGLKLALLKFPTNFHKQNQSISNKFQNYFKPNHMSLFEKPQPKLCKKDPLLNVKISKRFFRSFSCKLARYFKVAKSLRGN